MQKLAVLNNLRVIGPSKTFSGSIVIDGDIIAEVIEGRDVPGGKDCNGAWAGPGLVDIHSDFLEKELYPRPNTGFAMGLALRSLDLRAVTSGITTLCNGVSFRNDTSKSRDIDRALKTCWSIGISAGNGALIADHRIHARLDLCDDSLPAVMEKIIELPGLILAVYNDHTPGTRQFRDTEKYVDYITDVTGISRERAIERLTNAGIESARAQLNMRSIWESLGHTGLVIGSHDDATSGQVQDAMAHGATLSEFPVTIEAAKAAKRNGLFVSMGAPNLLLGKSQSGNLRCMDAIDEDCVDILASDYHLPSMLSAACLLMKRGFSPHRAFAYVSSNPALLLGMNGRIGSIEPGKRVDLVLFDIAGGEPYVRNVYARGIEVLRLFAGKMEPYSELMDDLCICEGGKKDEINVIN